MDADSTLPIQSPSVIFRELEDGGVIFSTVDEVYFGLNSVGAMVWSLLPPVTRTLGELTARLAASFPEVSPAVIHADVAELVAELEQQGLVVRPAAAGGGAGSGPGADDARATRTG